MMQRMHGRRSRKKAMRYRMMTNIWSCMMSAHADLGTNNTGNIQCKQYILHQMVALLRQRKKLFLGYLIVHKRCITINQ